MSAFSLSTRASTYFSISMPGTRARPTSLARPGMLSAISDREVEVQVSVMISILGPSSSEVQLQRIPGCRACNACKNWPIQ